MCHRCRTLYIKGTHTTVDSRIVVLVGRLSWRMRHTDATPTRRDQRNRWTLNAGLGGSSFRPAYLVNTNEAKCVGRSNWRMHHISVLLDESLVLHAISPTYQQSLRNISARSSAILQEIFSSYGIWWPRLLKDMLQLMQEKPSCRRRMYTKEALQTLPENFSQVWIRQSRLHKDHVQKMRRTLPFVRKCRPYLHGGQTMLLLHSHVPSQRMERPSLSIAKMCEVRLGFSEIGLRWPWIRPAKIFGLSCIQKVRGDRDTLTRISWTRIKSLRTLLLKY